MIFLNGEFKPCNQFNLDITDRGLLLGDGLFETIRIYSGKIFALEEHFNRLANSAKIAKIPFSATLEELQAICTKLIELNNLQASDSSIRITLTRGSAPRGLTLPVDVKPTIFAAIFPLVSSKHSPMKLHISRLIKRNEFSPLSKMKTLCYMENVLAKAEAAENQADDAVLLNTIGNIACTTIANIFMVNKDNIILTPRLEDGILAGVTRKYVIKMSRKYGYEVIETSISEIGLLTAHEVFITNSIIEIVPITTINNHIIRDGLMGKITKNLQEKFSNLVRETLNLEDKSQGNYQQGITMFDATSGKINNDFSVTSRQKFDEFKIEKINKI